MIDWTEDDEAQLRLPRPPSKPTGSRLQANVRDCAYKQAFRTRGEARRALERRRGDRAPSARLHAYRCDLGSHWHIGRLL